MSILSGFKKVKDRIMTDNGYQLISRWTSAETVEYNDGTDLQTKTDDIINHFRYPEPIDGKYCISLAFCEDLSSTEGEGGFLTLNFNNGGCVINCSMTGVVHKYGQLRGVIVNGIGGDSVYVANIQSATVTNASIYIYCVNHPDFTGEAKVNIIYIWEWK